MNSFYFHLKLFSKLFFLFALVFAKQLIVIFLKFFQLNPFELVPKLFFKFVGPFFFFFRRAWVFNSFFEFFFLNFPFFVFLVIVGFFAVCLVLPFIFPFFVFWLLAFFSRLFFFALVAGTFSYMYYFLLLALKFFKLCAHRIVSFFFFCFFFLLELIEQFTLFCSFLFTFLREFPTINSSKFFSIYRLPVLPFVSSFWSTQFGSISNARISESIEKADFYSIEPYFFVNLPESLVVEGLQIHEAMSGMSAPGYRRSSADSVIFLQILKQHKIRVPEGRPPLLYPSSLALNSYVLEDFVGVEFEYRMSWIKRNRPCAIPSKYEKYIFRKYLQTGLSSILDYYSFIASAVKGHSRFLGWSSLYAFRSLGLPSNLLSQLDKLELEPRDDYRQDFFDRFELFDEDDTEDEEFLSPLSRTTAYAGFHYVQQLDDFGSFSKPYAYVAPRFERFWFKRFLSSYFFKARSTQADDLGYFYQALHILFGMFSVFLFFVYFILSASLQRLQFFFGLTFKISPIFPFFRYVRETFFGFLNFISRPPQFLSRLENFLSFKRLSFGFKSILDLILIRCFLLAFHFFSFFKYFFFVLFTPFRFLRFLRHSYEQDRLDSLVSEELALQLGLIFEKTKTYLNLLRLAKFFN